MTDAADPIPNELEALRAALLAERAARQEAEARASGLDAMVAHLKLLIAKLRQERFGASAERGAKLDQLELQLEELEVAVSEDADRLSINVSRSHTLDRQQVALRAVSAKTTPTMFWAV